MLFFSVSRDRYFQFHNVKNGQRLGGYLCSAWCTALAYDEAAKYAFIGDYSGQITVCQLSENGVKLINVLKGHNGSIQSLNWDGTQGWLYSGKIFFDIITDVHCKPYQAPRQSPPSSQPVHHKPPDNFLSHVTHWHNFVSQAS